MTATETARQISGDGNRSEEYIDRVMRRSCMIRSPHIDRERRLVRGVLVACLASGIAIGAAFVDYFGAGALWCWIAIFVLVASAAARGLRVGQ
jgi:uncharacterized membrane protein YoaK (UPF0700 family)